MKVVSFVAALGLAAASSVALAGGEQGHGGRLKSADTNGDGVISKAEAAALPRLAKNFDAIDANKDGQISQDEMKAHGGKQRGEHFRKADTNGDGSLSRAEAQAGSPRLAEHFDKIDANKDGQLSKDELAAARAARK